MIDSIRGKAMDFEESKERIRYVIEESWDLRERERERERWGDRCGYEGFK